MAPALIEASATGPKSVKSKNWILGINNNLRPSNFDRPPLKFDKVVEKTACVFSLGDANLTTKSQLVHQLEPRDDLYLSKDLREQCTKDINSGMEYALSKDECADMRSTATDMRVPTVPSCENNVLTSETITTRSGSTSCAVDLCPANDVERKPQPIALRDSVFLSVKRRKGLASDSYDKLQRRASLLDSKLRRMQLNLVTSHLDQGTTQLRDLVVSSECGSNKGFNITEACTVESIVSENVQRNTENRHNLRRARHSSSDNGRDIKGNVKNRAGQSCRILSSHVDVLFHSSELEATDVESNDEDDWDADSSTSAQLSSAPESLRLPGDDAPCPETAWLSDRATAGSKCRWLEAQIADLDAKIRIYDNLNKHLLATQRGCKFQTFTPTPDNCGIKTVLDKDVKNIITTLPAKEDTCPKRTVNNNQINGIVHCPSIRREHPARPDTIKTKEEAGETSSCARACKLIQRPRHRYINVSKTTASRGKGNDDGSHLTGQCRATLQGCHLCDQGRKSWHTTLTGFKNHLDDGYHPKLSWDCDILLPCHLESLLRTNKVNCDVKPKAHKQSIKRCFEKRKLSAAPLRPSKLNCVPNQRILHRNDKKKSIANHSLSASYPGGLTSNAKNKIKISTPDIMKKKIVSVSAAAQLQKRAHRLSATFNEGSDLKSPTGNAFDSGNATSPQTPLPSPAASVRKKRGSSAFDINNIVIPYSMAAATRVEKLKYKEILTPGWRVVDDMSMPKKPKVEENHVDESMESEAHCEDISYAAFAMRHAACEVQERRRFSRFFQPLRRLKSQKNSECNTPEPHSPSSDDSPRHSLAGTPTLDNSGNGLSQKPRLQRMPSLLFPTPLLEPVEETVPPWPKLSFPLDESEFEKLRQDTTTTRTRSQSEQKNDNHVDTVDDSKDGNHLLSVTPPACDTTTNSSPSSTSDSSPTNADEGWTVKLLGNEKVVENDPGHCRKGIVLKLAKK